ncbi:hypothetical protein AMJ49_05225 [Parcubacteria bacterium DG_74_2]|nr:MAG: hypothetical protein AMJ49_05225 [Parcubacteria bacterium DG_74_2]
MNKKEKNKNKEELKKLVIERLEVLPRDKKISIGAEKEFTKEELIENVEKGSEIGKKVIEIQLEYLRALKEGIFYEQDFIDNKT